MGIKKGGYLLFILLLLSIFAFGGPQTSKAASNSNLSIMQIDSNLPDLSLYVRLDNAPLDSTKLKENLTINLDNTPAQITDIQPTNNVNTAYMFLVDTSISMQNRASQLQTLLEKLLGSTGPNDKTAVFGISNKTATLKDFNVSDTPQSVVQNIKEAINSGAGTGTYLYSGIRDAINMSRKDKDIPERRIIVLITDGGVDGDSFSAQDIEKYVDLDRLPVYTLILNNPGGVDQNFADAADQIAQKTGGESFLSPYGNDLYNQFKSSLAKCNVIKLRCDNFKPDNPQEAIITVGLNLDNSKIQQSAKFTPTQAPAVPANGSNPAQAQGKQQPGQMPANNKPEPKTSLFRSPPVLLAVILLIILLFAFIWFIKNNKPKVLREKGHLTPYEVNPKIKGAEMNMQKPQDSIAKISLQIAQGTNKGDTFEIRLEENPRIGSTPECAVQVDNGHKVFGYISAIDNIVIIHSQATGEVIVNGNVVQGSQILQNGDLLRVPGTIFKIVI